MNKEKLYKVKIKSSKPGFKNLYTVGLIIADGRKKASEKALETVSRNFKVEAAHSITEVELIKYHFGPLRV